MATNKQLEQLTAWWDTPVGKLLLQAELKQLETYLELLFGYKLLLIAPSCFDSLSHCSRMGQVLRIDPNEVATQSLPPHLDAIIIPHLLSYLPEVSDCIKGCWESLDAKGQLIITGYRRFSYLTWSRFCDSRLKLQIPSANNSQSKIKNLLRANSFNIIKQDNFAPNSSLFANGYVIVAQKELVLVKMSEPITWQNKQKMNARMATSGCQREQN
ncbi:MAG: hypothetical protein EXR81_00310 [Gammaproteobacteria bacterium]|nr:hypothetical protein [Gammaproteobacteria bacterium]